MERPSKERTLHGVLVGIWMALAKHSKGVGKSRARLEVYLAGPEFAVAFLALDPARRLLALQAAGTALERVATASMEPGTRSTKVSIRVKWTDPMRDRLRELAGRAPNDRALARELGLPLTKTKAMRHKLVGPKRTTPHISRRGPLQIAA